ncbi:hypothetical protein [Anaerococcus cruorum]
MADVSGTFIDDPEAADKILNTSIDLFLLPFEELQMGYFFQMI